MRKALHKIICLTLLLCVLLQGSCAFAEETAAAEQTGSITVSCPADGAQGRLWYLGSYDSNGKITMEGGFAAYRSFVNPNNKDAAATLANMATGAIAPLAEQTVKDGKLSFKDLKKGAYLLSVGDITVNGRWYRCSPMIFWLPYDDGNGPAWNLMTEIKHESGEVPSALSVRKIWSSDSANTRPATLYVDIYCGGVYQSTATLNKDNNWSYSWNTAGACDWSVRERSVPSGYSLQISATEYGFKLVNTGTVTPPNKLPQTGQLWWPVPVLLSAGLLLLLIGVVRRKRS